MNFLKRAMTSISRRPGKSVILLLLVFILGTMISGAIAVDGAVRSTESNLRLGMRPLVTFQFDWEAQQDYIIEHGLTWEDIEADPVLQERFHSTVTADLVRVIGALPYVEEYEFSVATWVETRGLNNFNLWMDLTDEEMFFPSESELVSLNIRGTSTPDMVQIREGVVDLVAGRSFTENELLSVSDVNPVVISAGFARVNNLSVNDTFEIIQTIVFPEPDGTWDINWAADPENVFAEEVHQFEVIGIVDLPPGVLEELDPNSSDMDDQIAFQRAENAVGVLHVSNPVAELLQRFQAEQRPLMMAYAIESDRELSPWLVEEFENIQNMGTNAEEDEISVTSVMLLSDPLEMDAFIEAAEELLPEFWTVINLAGGFDAISSSMETLQNIAFWILWVSVGATLLILSLLITLFLRDRRYEMGVYLALGEKKGKIISQILLEVVAIAIIGITLAVFTGNVISDVMSTNMLRNQLAAGSNDDWSNVDWEFIQLGISTEVSQEQLLDAFDVSLSIETIGLFYAIGLGAVILSTIVPVIYVVTLNPKKVLM